jgi:hypothetical protein
VARIGGGGGIRLDCRPAARSSIRAFSYPGHLVVRAEGEVPTPCHQVEIERVFPGHGSAPEYSLRQCLDPRVRCMQVVTPYDVSEIFAERHVPDEITVHHAEGSDRVRVEPLEEPVVGAEPAPAGEERAGPVGRTVVGRSASWSFQEAFADAVSQIPVQAFADALLRVRVEDVGGEFGGIAGFHHLYVEVRVV